MKRWILAICLLMLFSSLTLIGVCGWLLRSDHGAAWLLETVAAKLDVQITTSQLHGPLAEELLAQDLVISWPGGELIAQRVRLAWDPLSLLQKQLKVVALEVDRLVITTRSEADNSPATTELPASQPFSAKDLAFLPDWLTVQVDHLKLLGFSLKSEDSETLIAEEISGNYFWSQRQLKGTEFSYLSPFVDLRGDFDWDLQSPHLLMNAAVHLPEDLVDPQILKNLAVPIDFPAQLDLAGDWNGFTGPVRFGHTAEVADNVWLSAEAAGSWQGIRFDNLQARYLNGSLNGDLALAWTDAFKMSGTLNGNDLNPALLNKELDGRARFEVSGELLMPYADLPLQANIGVVIHAARLRGHSIAGSAAATWQNGTLQQVKLDLTGHGARVVARGKPAERLELELDVADLSPFYAGLAGRLAASGWLRWSDAYLTGKVQGSGENLTWQDMACAGLTFKGQHLEPGGPLALELDGQGVVYGESSADHLRLGISGDLEQHDVNVAVTGPIGELELQMTGQYREPAWQAQLLSMTAKTPEMGRWKLAAPARLAWQPGQFSLDDFSLVSPRGEQVTIELTDREHSKHTLLDFGWHDLSHDWLVYLHPPHIPSGRSSGELHMELIELKPVALRTRVTAFAVLQNDLSVVKIPVLNAEASWQKEGLTLDLSAESDSGENLVMSAHSSQPPSWQWPPEQLSFDLRWQGLELERISRYRPDIDAQGYSDGGAQLEIMNGKLLRVHAKASAEGHMRQKAQPVGFRSVMADLEWDKQHFHCSAHIEGAHEGVLDLNLTSTSDPVFAWPGSGQIELEVDKLHLKSLNPFLPDEMTLDGAIHGKSSGYWLDGGQIFLDGQVKFTDSGLLFHRREGQIDIQVPQADIEWQWQGAHLTGSLALQLAKEGEFHGNWQLPVPAQWPFAIVTDGALQASLHGQLQATGMLAAIAPGLVQDLHGQINTDLQVGGTWQEPVLSGHIELLEAGAYLPATGITLEDLKVQAALQGTHIKINEFSLRSGPGILSGSGIIDLDRWQLASYKLDLHGERLQVYNFPELQMLCSPDLTLSGSAEGLKLDGNILVPEMSLLGATTAPEVLPSTDVILFDEEPGRRRILPFAADIRVAIELGDQVRVKASGIDTRLEGGGMVTLDEQDHLAVWGEISLAEGVYKAYGANLSIKQGLLKYNGGQATNPGLSILAVREVGTVLAGVQVTGTAEAPVVSLYSQPTMPERDILGYIFMGRPMRADQQGEDALRIGAGALLPNYGGTFSDLGISEIDIQGLFSGTGGVSLRKRISESWELESTLGVESGVDLYYLFKFD